MRVYDPPGQDTNPSQVSPQQMRVYYPPGQNTNPSQVSPQKKLVLISTAESTGACGVKYLAQGHNAVVRPGFELTTFRLGVRQTIHCLITKIYEQLAYFFLMC